MEYTQEQVDAMLADAKKGLYTEEDFQRKLTSEVDRRVETGIQKGLETQKSKWEKEFEDRAKLTAEELAKKQLQEQEQILTERQREIQAKENKIKAIELLSEASVPKSHYEKMLGVLITSDETATVANVQSFIDVFTETKTSLETQIKGELSKVGAPAKGTTTEGVTKDDFKKMTYAQQLEYKKTNPEQFKQFISE